MKNIIGRKIGMTQIFQEDGRVIPVTVIQAGPIYVVQKKTVEKDGYNAIQVGFGDVKETRLNKPMKGHFEKGGVPYKRYLKEFRVENPDEFEIGQEIKADVFQEGDMVDITGTSKGKGTQGVIKRHGFSRGRETHGSRCIELLVVWAQVHTLEKIQGHRMAGRMGNERVTVQNLEIVRVDADKNLILVKGGIPGPKKGLITIKATTKRQ